ncbi:ArsC family transcriptional regulator [Bacteroidetes/Chlorobi group bacterium ChocPot_Mid]|nr:MAG: ArsC family transcriptional regulator [Bacteroidetes/Chlorobi group bacterium ChocPot_Mid]
MVIQIFGTLKCKDTQKAIRFFKERKITPHFVDLNEKAITKGELDNITRTIPIENLLDKESKEFKKKGLEYMIFDIQETLLENPLLLKTPIVRFEKKTTLGYEPEIWKNWLKI